MKNNYKYLTLSNKVNQSPSSNSVSFLYKCIKQFPYIIFFLHNTSVTHHLLAIFIEWHALIVKTSGYLATVKTETNPPTINMENTMSTIHFEFVLQNSYFISLILSTNDNVTFMCNFMTRTFPSVLQ